MDGRATEQARSVARGFLDPDLGGELVETAPVFPGRPAQKLALGSNIPVKSLKKSSRLARPQTVVNLLGKWFWAALFPFFVPVFVVLCCRFSHTADHQLWHPYLFKCLPPVTSRYLFLRGLRPSGSPYVTY